MKKDVAGSLVSTGIRLIAKRGSQVSLREIQRKAGVLNEGAIRYHFGRRENFIAACMRDISNRFGAITVTQFAAFEQLKSERAVTVKDVSGALVKSLHSFLIQDKDSVWFMARMIREEGSLGQDLLITCFGPMIWRLEEELKLLLPHKQSAMLRLHLFLAINSTLNGMVDQDLLWRLPGLAGEDRFRLNPEEFANGFLQYITAGMSIEEEPI